MTTLPPQTKVLAVDDNRANLVAIDAVLSRQSEVVYANSGPEAIAYLKEHQDVDVILMDVQMPLMDGYEASTIIKTLPGYHDIPIVFVTAVYIEDPHVKRGYAAGGVDYFSKPFDPDILRLKVGVYASFRQRHAMLKERERQIRESEEVLKAARKMSAILESLSVGVIIADHQGSICQTNEEVSRILKSAHDIEADAYGKVLRWWDSEGRMLKDAVTKALDGQPIRNEQLPVRCLDGTVKSLNVSTSPLRGLNLGVVGVVIVIQDVTEHLKIGEDFENKITRLITLGVEIEQSQRADS